MVIELKQWIQQNVDYLFEYALGFMGNTGITSPTPKLHMRDKTGKIAVISLDFWNSEDQHSPQDYKELGHVIDNMIKSFDAAVSLLAFVGEINEESVICILTIADGITPELHYKPIIWHANVEFIDFGPATKLPCHKVKNLKF